MKGQKPVEDPFDVIRDLFNRQQRLIEDLQYRIKSLENKVLALEVKCTSGSGICT